MTFVFFRRANLPLPTRIGSAGSVLCPLVDEANVHRTGEMRYPLRWSHRSANREEAFPHENQYTRCSTDGQDADAAFAASIRYGATAERAAVRQPSRSRSRPGAPTATHPHQTRPCFRRSQGGVCDCVMGAVITWRSNWKCCGRVSRGRACRAAAERSGKPALKNSSRTACRSAWTCGPDGQGTGVTGSAVSLRPRGVLACWRPVAEPGRNQLSRATSGR